MFIYLHAYMFIYLHAYIFIYMHAYIFIYMHAYMYICSPLTALVSHQTLPWTCFHMIADRGAQNLGIIAKTLSMYQDSAHGIYD